MRAIGWPRSPWMGCFVVRSFVQAGHSAMPVSLETRMPSLDHWVVEAAWTLSCHMFNRSGRRKLVHREIHPRHLPPEFME